MTLYKNHDSIEKQICREKVIHIVENIQKNPIKVLTLPSTNFYLEEVLLKIKNVEVDCCERERQIYKQQLDIIKDRRLNIQLKNSDIFKYIKEGGKQYDVIWLDLCGPFEPIIISNFLSLIQSREFISPQAFIVLTIMGRREHNGDKILELYGCKDLKEFRESKFSELVKDFASMANKNCDLQDIYEYSSGIRNTPMKQYTFKVTNN